MTGGSRHAQHGGMMSLLLSLLAVGLLAYFALRGTGGRSTGALGNDQNAVSCEQQVSKLIAKTGGQGPDYKTGYEALPSSCRSLLPPPAALAAPALPET